MKTHFQLRFDCRALSLWWWQKCCFWLIMASFLHGTALLQQVRSARTTCFRRLLRPYRRVTLASKQISPCCCFCSSELNLNALKHATWKLLQLALFRFTTYRYVLLWKLLLHFSLIFFILYILFTTVQCTKWNRKIKKLRALLEESSFFGAYKILREIDD